MSTKSYFFFGAIDRKGNREDGEIASEYPAWTMKRQVETLREERDGLEGQISRGEIRPDEIMYTRARIEAMDKKLKMTERPEYSDAEKNSFYKGFKYLKEQIRNNQPTQSEMQMGTADPHLEADRISLPCIDIGKEGNDLVEIARDKIGIRNIKNGKISRYDAERMAYVLGAAVDDEMPITAESFRRDRVTEAGKKKYFEGADIPKS